MPIAPRTPVSAPQRMNEVAGGGAPRTATTTPIASSPSGVVIAITVGSERRRLVSPPRKSETPHDALAASARRIAASCLGLDGPGGGDRVQLVRVIEHGGLGRLRGAGVVVRGDRVQELGA